MLELANVPTTREGDQTLFDRPVLLIPDVLANACGVVKSYFEWIQNQSSDRWEDDKVLEKLENIMISAFHSVLSACLEEKCTMRKTVYKIAVKRILNAGRLRGNL